jgi:large subunit ribosomal protein L9
MSKYEKVIFLHKNKWGGKYEIKELPRGFILNYLLPQGEAIFYNQKNLVWVEKQKAQEEKKNLLLAAQAQELYQKINNFTLEFTLNKDEKGQPFGSVGNKEILAKLSKLGFDLNKGQLVDFQPLHQLGENLVKVKVSNGLVAQIKIIIK